MQTEKLLLFNPVAAVFNTMKLEKDQKQIPKTTEKNNNTQPNYVPSIIYSQFTESILQVYERTQLKW